MRRYTPPRLRSDGKVELCLEDAGHDLACWSIDPHGASYVPLDLGAREGVEAPPATGIHGDAATLVSGEHSFTAARTQLTACRGTSCTAFAWTDGVDFRGGTMRYLPDHQLVVLSTNEPENNATHVFDVATGTTVTAKALEGVDAGAHVLGMLGRNVSVLEPSGNTSACQASVYRLPPFTGVEGDGSGRETCVTWSLYSPRTGKRTGSVTQHTTTFFGALGRAVILGDRFGTIILDHVAIHDLATGKELRRKPLRDVFASATPTATSEDAAAVVVGANELMVANAYGQLAIVDPTTLQARVIMPPACAPPRP